MKKGLPAPSTIVRWAGDIDPRHFEVINAKEIVCDPNDDKTERGAHYVTWHCRAAVHGRRGIEG